MQNTKTAAFDLNRAQTLTLRDLRGLLTERAEHILRSLEAAPVAGPGLQPSFINTRLFIRSVAPHLRMN